NERSPLVLPNRLQRIGYIAIVFNGVFTAGREDSLRSIVTQRPLNHVQVMRTEVRELPAGVVPEPTKLVQTAVWIVRHPGRRAEPEVPVQSRRRVTVRRIANALRKLVSQMVTLGDAHLADGSGTDHLDDFLNVGRGAPVQTDLGDALGLFRDR